MANKFTFSKVDIIWCAETNFPFIVRKKRALIINVTTSANIFVGAFFSNRDMTGHETFRNADSASPVFFYRTISVNIEKPMTQHSAYTPCLHGYP